NEILAGGFEAENVVVLMTNRDSSYGLVDRRRPQGHNRRERNHNDNGRRDRPTMFAKNRPVNQETIVLGRHVSRQPVRGITVSAALRKRIAFHMSQARAAMLIVRIHLRPVSSEATACSSLHCQRTEIGWILVPMRTRLFTDLHMGSGVVTGSLTL